MFLSRKRLLTCDQCNVLCALLSLFRFKKHPSLSRRSFKNLLQENQFKHLRRFQIVASIGSITVPDLRAYNVRSFLVNENEVTLTLYEEIHFWTFTERLTHNKPPSICIKLSGRYLAKILMFGTWVKKFSMQGFMMYKLQISFHFFYLPLGTLGVCFRSFSFPDRNFYFMNLYIYHHCDLWFVRPPDKYTGNHIAKLLRGY